MGRCTLGKRSRVMIRSLIGAVALLLSRALSSYILPKRSGGSDAGQSSYRLLLEYASIVLDKRHIRSGERDSGECSHRVALRPPSHEGQGECILCCAHRRPAKTTTSLQSAYKNIRSSRGTERTWHFTIMMITLLAVCSDALIYLTQTARRAQLDLASEMKGAGDWDSGSTHARKKGLP